MAMINTKLNGNLQDDEFIGVKNFRHLEDKIASAALEFYDDETGKKHCVMGGTFQYRNKEYIGVGVGTWDEKEKRYAVHSPNIERIALVALESVSTAIKRRNRSEISTKLKMLANDLTNNTYHEFLEKFHKIFGKQLILSTDIPLIGGRFQSKFSIPYPNEEEAGLYYPARTVFVCEEVKACSEMGTEMNKKLVLTVEGGVSDILIDSSMLFTLFWQIDEDGNIIL